MDVQRFAMLRDPQQLLRDLAPTRERYALAGEYGVGAQEEVAEVLDDQVRCCAGWDVDSGDVGLGAAGAGALAMLFFSWDVLLAVAVELAFSVAAVRVATRVEREGWLTAAVRLTWKPLFGRAAVRRTAGRHH